MMSRCKTRNAALQRDSVGCLLRLKKCLRLGIVPFIITDDLKAFYYRGLQNWETERGYLRDTCGFAQDHFQQILAYFNIS